MHDAKGFFCKTDNHWIKLKSQVREKNTHGLNLLGPTVERKKNRGGALGSAHPWALARSEDREGRATDLRGWA